MEIKAVFFDLGSTLVYPKNSWEDYFRRGDEACAQVFRKAGIPIDNVRFYQEYGTFLDQYYAQLNPANTHEVTAYTAMEGLLIDKGFMHVPADVIREGLAAMYAITNRNWTGELDAPATLDLLVKSGYHLGIISNTSDDDHVQAIIDDQNIRSYFEFILTSAKFGFRKPDPKIFQMALDHFKLRPQEAAMVGDTQDADILGANNIGIFSIWITRRAAKPDPCITPKAIVGSLAEIPPLLQTIK